ncbi:hypothetical protein, partial [Brucella suis]|uniref:hypothetical protein n=1 Tax=Brucella suis TaxID=29461 RepID=UPI003A5C4F38
RRRTASGTSHDPGGRITRRQRACSTSTSASDRRPFWPAVRASTRSSARVRLSMRR